VEKLDKLMKKLGQEEELKDTEKRKTVKEKEKRENKKM
jgi:hypothetical protein